MLNKKIALLTIIFAICGLIFNYPLFAEPTKSTTDSSLINKENMPEDFIPGQVIVALKNGYEISLSTPNIFSELASSFEILTKAKRPANVNASLVVSEDNIVLLQLKNSKKQAVLDAIYRLKSCPDVRSVQPNYKLKLCNTDVNDTYYNKLYALEKICAPKAWEKTVGNPSVVVGVIDTGIDYNHPDLKDNIWRNPGEIPGNKIDDDNNGYIDDVYGCNFVANSYDPTNNDPMDNNSINDNYHGTHVAGIIAGIGNNSQGIAGVAWKVKVAALKIGDAAGGNKLSDAIRAVDYANKMGFPITNNSYGFDPYDSIMKDTIGKGGLFVVAAGNGWTDSNNDNTLTDDERNNDIHPHYPACYDCPNVISVAASDINDKLVGDSRFGKKTVHLAAPGQDIWSCMKDNRYQPKSGTSMSAPYVAGAAALLKSYNPELTPVQIKNAILNNVDKIPELSDKVSTGGRLNVYKAISSIAPAPLKAATLSLDKSVYTSNDKWTYTFTTTPAIPNTPMYVTSWRKSGNSYEQYHIACIGNTDAAGKLTKSGMFESGLVGEWKQQAKIGDTYSNEIYFTVNEIEEPSLSSSTAIISFPVTSDLSFNGKKLSTLTKVMNGSGTLIKNTDYAVTDNALIIKKSYLNYYFNKFPGYTLRLTAHYGVKTIYITIKQQIVTLSLNKSVYISNDKWTYTVTTTPAIPNTPVYVTSWRKSGNSYVQYHIACIGNTDAAGKLTKSGMFESGLVGEWKQQAKIGDKTSNEIYFTVNQAPQTVTLSLDKSVYKSNDKWTYTVTTTPAIPNTPVYVTSWRKSGNSYVQYYSGCIGNTDAAGKLITSGVFDSSAIGEWKQQAKIGDKTSNEIYFIINK